WAPNSDRIFEEKPEEGDELSSYEVLQVRIDHLENVISKIEPFSRLIGSNNPPQEIGVPPYADEDQRDLQQAIHVFRKTEAELAENPEDAVKASEVFRKKGEKLKGFFERHGDKFVESFA
ncbi:hypothetical protein AB4144_56940, partial [Rhizobiaceae sp. 2RAB30]